VVLEKTIAQCRAYIEQGLIRNEASEIRSIINLILNDLGWNVPGCIEFEFNVEGVKADYALLDDNGVVKCFIEAKAEGDMNIYVHEKLFDYAVSVGQVPLLVLTDGVQWDFYLTVNPIYKKHENMFAHLNLLSKNVPLLIESLSKYLNRDNVISGASYEVAKTDFEQLKLNWIDSAEI